MTGKVIAVANMKGGVGKTATVIGIAETLAADTNSRVLVMDFDPQASASITLAGDHYLAKLVEEGHTIEGFMEDYLLRGRQIRFDDCIRDHISNVYHKDVQLPISLLASSVELRTLELRLIYRLTNNRFSLQEIVNRLLNMLKEQLKEIKERFDFIVVDCPPGISILTEASIRLADMVIVPTIPDTLSTYGLQAFCNSIWPQAASSVSLFKRAQKRNLPHVLLTRTNHTNQQQRITQAIANTAKAESPPFNLFATAVPERAAIAQALAETTPNTYSKKWGQPVVQIMTSLTAEIRGSLNVH